MLCDFSGSTTFFKDFACTPSGSAITTRENPSSSAGFEASSSAGGRATNKALQLTYSSSAVPTRATTVDDISSAFFERATIN